MGLSGNDNGHFLTVCFIYCDKKSQSKILCDFFFQRRIYYNHMEQIIQYLNSFSADLERFRSSCFYVSKINI